MAQPKSSYRVLVTDYVWPSLEPERKVLSEIGAEIIETPDQSEATLAELARDADAVMTCFAQVTKKVIEAATKCVVISRYGVGVDNISVDTATEQGIPVTYVPDYCVDEVSDHVMALLLSWNRQIQFYDVVAKIGDWSGTASPYPLMRLRGRTLGIVGLGRIGQVVAKKAQSFGLNIVAFDPYVSSEQAASIGVQLLGLPDLMTCSDYITLHPPLNDDTRALIDANLIGMMKEDAYIINCARGPIIDEQALYQALSNHSIGGAGLDVMQAASPPSNHPLFSLDNVQVTPHVAFLSQQSVLELEIRTAQATVDVLQGRMPEFLVNHEVLDHSRIYLNAR